MVFLVQYPLPIDSQSISVPIQVFKASNPAGPKLVQHVFVLQVQRPRKARYFTSLSSVFPNCQVRVVRFMSARALLLLLFLVLLVLRVVLNREPITSTATNTQPPRHTYSTQPQHTTTTHNHSTQPQSQHTTESHKQSREPQNSRPWQHAPHHGMKTSD